jgi:TP901 family phage tail tape measure protein
VAISSRELLLVLRARDEASRVLRGAAADINGVSAAAHQAAQKQMQTGAAMATVGVGVAYAGLKALEFMKDATDAAIEYNRQSALTLTQVDKTGVSIGKIKTIGREVGASVPTDFKKIQTSLYDIFSSMDVSVPEAQHLLTEFSKASVAGQVDLQDASRATIGIMNAYGLKAKDVNTINDIMFQLVRKGVGTYGEFASTIGRAVPSAVRAGQSVSTLAGMMAFLTRNGLSAAMASSSAGRALDAISNPKTIQHFASLGDTIGKVMGNDAAIARFGPGYKKMSIQIKDAEGNIRPMPQLMTELGQTIGNLPPAQRAAVLYELFKSSGGTIQARRFFDTAVTGYKQLTSLTDAMVNSKGAMQDAYKTMFDTPAMQLQLLSNRWEILKTQIGDALIPVRNFIVQGLNAMLAAWNSLNPAIQQGVIYFFAIVAALAVVGGAIVAIAGLWTMMSAAAVMAGTTIGAILAPVGIILGVIVALGAAIFLVWKYHEQLEAIALRVWNAISPPILFVWGVIQRLAALLWNTLKPALEDLWHVIQDNFNQAVKDLSGAWDELKASLMSAWESIQPWMPYLKNFAMFIGVVLVGAIIVAFGIIVATISVAVRVVGAVIQALAQIIKGIVEVIGGVVALVSALLTGDWSRAWEAAKQIVRGFVDIIEGLLRGLANVVIGIIKGLWDGVIAIFTAAYHAIVGGSIIPDMVNGIVRWMASLPGKVMSAVSSLLGQLVSWATSVMARTLAAFTAGGNHVVSFMASLPGRIVSAVSGLAGSLYNAGVNALNALYNGAVSAGGKVISYVSGLANQVRSLWPFSPAKAGPLRRYPLEKAGATMMNQLSKGIESNRDLVLSSMKGIAYDVSQVQPSAPVVSDFGGPRPPDAGMGGTNQNFYITTQEIDPTKHAADLGWELERRRG